MQTANTAMQTADTDTAQSRLEAELRRIRAHMEQRQFAQALQLGQALLPEA
jgi:hypothetical protein